MNLNRPMAALAAAVALGAGASAHAATITFEPPAFGPGFTGPTTESGFTYSAASGDLFVNNHGNPGQDMEGTAAKGGGVLDIVAASSSTFSFSGLDFAAYLNHGGGSQILSVTGYLGGAAVATDLFTLANTNIFSPSYPNWTHFGAVNLAGQSIDDLQITLNAKDTKTTDLFIENIEGVDNVVLTGGGVPEPATWAMMLLGFGGLGATLRARRRIATA